MTEGWMHLPNHPDIPDQLTAPDGDLYGEDGELVEDFVDYIGRVDTYLSEHPPAAPPGFFLIPCDATPRHQPEYMPVFNEVYEPNCRACSIGTLIKDHAPCRHKPWRRWRVTKWALGWGYAHGLVRSYGIAWDAYCKGCVSGISWGRSQWFKQRNEGDE